MLFEADLLNLWKVSNELSKSHTLDSIACDTLYKNTQKNNVYENFITYIFDSLDYLASQRS